MSKGINPALLPSGFVDLLPPEAEQEFGAISALMKTFASFGYQRVKPPLVEFEESLFAPGPGASLMHDTFRVMDPVSHRMMGVRSDITPQIARISSSRLADEPRPLRLTYANDVLRTKASQQRTERQFCQVGCEIIGDEDPQTDIESCVVALAGLRMLGVKDITIDLALPPLLPLIFEAHKVSEEAQENIKSMIARKDVDGLKGLDKKLADVLPAIMITGGAGAKAMEKIKALKISPDLQREIKKLQGIYEGLEKAVKAYGLDEISITIDLLESRGFKYYCGVGFTIFSKNISGALGRGGRYNVPFAGHAVPESATGFTLYMDTVRKAMPVPEQREIIFAPFDADWAQVKKLQYEGRVIVRGAKGSDVQNRCTHILDNGTVKKR